MFIVISDADHDIMLDNCNMERNMERWDEYDYATENPIFLAMTFERACECVSRYYYMLDDDMCPEYTIYEINEGSWTVKGKRSITIDVDRHDA